MRCPAEVRHLGFADSFVSENQVLSRYKYTACELYLNENSTEFQ